MREILYGLAWAVLMLLLAAGAKADMVDQQLVTGLLIGIPGLAFISMQRSALRCGGVA